MSGILAFCFSSFILNLCDFPSALVIHPAAQIQLLAYSYKKQEKKNYLPLDSVNEEYSVSTLLVLISTGI